MKVLMFVPMAFLMSVFTGVQVYLFTLEGSGLPIVEWGFARESELLPILRLVISILFFCLFSTIYIFADMANLRRAVQKQANLDFIAL